MIFIITLCLLMAFRMEFDVKICTPQKQFSPGRRLVRRRFVSHRCTHPAICLRLHSHPADGMRNNMGGTGHRPPQNVFATSSTFARGVVVVLRTILHRVNPSLGVRLPPGFFLVESVAKMGSCRRG